MEIIIVKDMEEMSARAAEIVATQIKELPHAVLGLATGGTPERMYEMLIEDYSDLVWKDIVTFNLDEYIGIPKDHTLSYHTYMQTKLFDHVDLFPDNTNVPNGNGDIAQNGEDYDLKIEEAGGIDLQILGIGNNAHIAFNEPGSPQRGGTGQVNLTNSTIKANAKYFETEEDVPKTAITMGIGTIMKSKKIVLLACGAAKAKAIKDSLEGDVSEIIPGSFLQRHKDVTVIIDKAAASELSKKD